MQASPRETRVFVGKLPRQGEWQSRPAAAKALRIAGAHVPHACARRGGHPEALEVVYGFWKMAMDSTVVKTPLALPRTCSVSALVYLVTCGPAPALHQ